MILACDLGLPVVEAVALRRGERDAEGHPARNDRHLPHRIGAFGEHPDDRVAALVVRRAAPILEGHHHLPLGPEHDPLERVGEVRFLNRVVPAPGGKQRCLVDEIGEVGPDHPRRRRRNPAEVDVRRKRDVPRVHLEDRFAAGAVRRLHDNAAVEAPGRRRAWSSTSGRFVAAITITLGRGVEAVHLGEDLVQRLLALVVAAAEAGHA